MRSQSLLEAALGVRPAWVGSNEEVVLSGTATAGNSGGLQAWRELPLFGCDGLGAKAHDRQVGRSLAGPRLLSATGSAFWPLAPRVTCPGSAG
jgi:hypothetical protein